MQVGERGAPTSAELSTKEASAEASKRDLPIRLQVQSGGGEPQDTRKKNVLTDVGTQARPAKCRKLARWIVDPCKMSVGQAPWRVRKRRDGGSYRLWRVTLSPKCPTAEAVA